MEKMELIHNRKWKELEKRIGREALERLEQEIIKMFEERKDPSKIHWE